MKEILKRHLAIPPAAAVLLVELTPRQRRLRIELWLRRN